MREIVVSEPGEVVEVRDPGHDQLVRRDALGEELLPVTLAGDAELLVLLGEPEHRGGRDAPGHQPGLAPHPGPPVGLLHDAFLDQDPGDAGEPGRNDRIVGTDPEVVIVPLGSEVDPQPTPVQLVGAEAAALVPVNRRLEETELENRRVVRPIRVVRREEDLDLGQGASDLHHLASLIGRAADEQDPRHPTHRRLARAGHHPHRARARPQHPPRDDEREHRPGCEPHHQREPRLTGGAQGGDRAAEAQSEGGHRPEEQCP
jgi:hypothetical protein